MSEPDLTKRQQLEEIKILRPKSSKLEYVNLELSGNDENKQISHTTKSRLQFLIQTAPSVIFYLDRKYRILELNTEAEQINFFKCKDILGKNYLELFVPERNREKINKDVEKVLTKNHTCVFESFMRCADGTEKLFSWELNRIAGNSDRPSGIIAVGRNVTDQQQYYKLACIQRDLAIKLGSVNQLEEGLNLCLETAIKASEMDCGGVYLLDEISGAFELAFHKGLSEEFIKSVTFYDVNSDNTKLVMKGKPVYAEYEQLDLFLDGTKKLEGLRAVAVMPILYEERIIGCLNVASHVFEHICTQSRVALETIAAQIGSTVARLKTKENLYDREQMYRKLVDASNEAVFVLDLDARITYVSPQGIELLGYEKAEDVIGLNGFQSLTPDEVEKGRNHFQQTIIDGFVKGVEHTFVKKDGTRIRVENNAAVVSDAQGQPKALIITSRDVTERRKAEEALRNSEEQLRLAVKAAQLSSWDWDLLTNDVLIGDHSNEVLGLPADIKSLPIGYLLSNINKENIRQVRQAISKAINEKTLYSAEYRIQRPDGTERWIEAKGQPLYDKKGKVIRMIGMNRDITERKEAEEQLRKSQERFKVLFELAPDAYYIHNLECTFIDINKAVEELVGYSREEIVGNNFFEMNLATEEDISKVLMALSDNKDGKPAGPLELTLFRKDGSKCIVETCSYPVEIDGQTVVLGIARDITERKHLEEAYRNLVDHTIQGLEITQDGRIVFLNKAFSSITGYSEEELLAASEEQIRELVHPEDREFVWSLHRDRLAGKPVPDHYEFRGIRKNGNIHWVEIHASRIKYHGRPAIQAAFIDITERKKAEEQLQNIFNLSLDMVCIVDINTNTFIKINPAFESTLGYTEQELLGRPFIEFIHPEDIEKTLNMVREKLRKGYKVMNFENRYLCKDGSYRWFNWAAHPVHEEGLTYAVAHDITERRKIQEAIRQERDKAQKYLDVAGVMIMVIGADRKVKLINQKGCQILGFNEEEIVGKDWFDNFLPKRVHEKIKYIEDKLWAGGTKEIEYFENPILTKSGQERTIAWHNALLWDEEGKPTAVLCSGEDVTDRRRLEEAYHRLVDHSIQGLSIIQDGKMVFLNKAFSLITGYSERDMSTASPEQLRALVHPEDQDMVWTRHRDRLAGKPVPDRYEFRCLTKDGSTRWLEIHASKIEYLGRPAIQSAFIDIIKRKEAQEALKQSREKIQKQNEFLNNVLESLTYPLLVIDANNYKVKIANAAARVTKLSGQATCYGLLHGLDKPCDKSNYPCPIREIKSFGRAVTTEHVHKGNSNSPQYVEVHSCPIVDDKGNVTDIIEYCFDITKRKRAEEKLIAYQAQLRSLASELSLAEERERRHIATALHDQISQTLALSKINLQTLGKSAGLADSSILKEIIKSIENTIEQVQSLTFDLSSPTLYKFGLGKAIDELLCDYIKKTGMTYTLEVDKSQKPLDEDIMVLLFQSVRELLINIIKHAQARKVEVTINRNQDSIRIIVCDDGVGFDTNWFESYEQRTGGFGLFNIRERLNYISGSFKIESRPGKGSRITLIAPQKDSKD
jgi:PAS domain S-box-containing protein